MADTVQVIYIMGSGRSGSTVLDTVLGSHERIESVGELSTVTQDGWIDGTFCACGERGADCPFWSRVRRRFEAQGGDIRAYGHLQREFERIRSLGKVLGSRKRPGAEFREWSRQTLALFRALRDSSEKEILVDSSKIPVRGLGLGLVEGLDVFYAHLVRDGRGVAWSLAQAHAKNLAEGIERDIAPRSLTRSTLTWSAVNAISGFVRRRAPEDRRVLLRYEDYVRDLPATLEKFSAFVGGDMRSLAERAARGEELSPGHTVAGNRLRMQGSVRLQPDTRWIEGMSATSRRLLWGLAWPWMRGYGYRP